MITLNVLQRPKPLGDQLDAVFLGCMISVINREPVNIYSPDSPLLDYFKNFIGWGYVHVNRPISGTVIEYSNTKDQKFYSDCSKQFEKIPPALNIPKTKIPLPEKYITTQWDAKQKYRKLEPHRIGKIQHYYQDLGYELIDVGNGKMSLDDTIAIMAGADYHIGADSGMMHIAKFLMSIEKIHVYINIRNRYNDVRFPDDWNVAFMAREIFRRGAKMNYCETPSQGEIEYFARTELWD